MATEIKVPTLGESVNEATVARWLKQPGDTVAMDDPLVELETDKVTLEVNAPAAGTLTEVLFAEGANVGVGAVLGTIGEGGAKPAPAKVNVAQTAAPAAAPAPRPASAKPAAPPPAAGNGAVDILARSGPAARKAAAETGVDVTKVAPTGKDGRVTKSDIAAAASAKPAPAPIARPASDIGPREIGPREERVRMTRLRKRIAERLKDAQNTAAMLTTFNEVDMTEVMALRERYRESFEKQHGVRLGFMSLFAKACIQALKEIPAANAEIDGDDIIYKNHYDLGIAVGTEQGLVVPVVRDADQLGFADIEKRVADLGRRARDGKLSLDELSGGTFTITNGGVYGSLLSTPILNPPQSAILGMHKIQKRPVVIGDKIEARPMMYLALSYDHRMIDGREAVTFLVRVKECIEDPQRMLFGI
ncbi:MAG TPA: 2-oxoglutarate dehydrogenase complex dihydrolipoyllysine-residue succinyltransferase [Stellaceae bacterium]|jgi:2-oxoglutarate dehydrogenase E2 component (dihydrolipoamide succinyltransferase)|nr:2-oxoglutarate dehydrogenase complex dihydrolipoyllysine-residue succinyltransferase [Stellaceae bacterium]